MSILFKGVSLDPKMLNMILFFVCLDCGRTSKIGLMKYLFYSDFTYYRDFNNKISNEDYVRLDNGPCPDNWKYYLDYLKNKKLIKEDEKTFINREGKEIKGHYFSLAKGTIADDLFIPREIQRMRSTYAELSKYNSSQLAELSHSEAAWFKTKDYKRIDMKYAYFIDLLTSDVEEEETIPSEVEKAVSELERAKVI